MCKIDTDTIVNYCDDKIEFILDTLAIEYKNDGDWIKLKCIFHGGDHYNLMYKEKFFYCFSQCNKAYNIINIVEKSLGMSYGKAIGWLTNLFHLDNTEYIPISAEPMEQLKLLKSICKNKNRKQVEFNELPEEILETITFGLTHSLLTKEGFDKTIFEHFNLGLSLSGFFENRIFIPIYSPKGVLFSASGRAIPKDLEPKYLLFPDANKENTLYNYNMCKDSVWEKKIVYVFEGFKSVWRAFQWGAENSIAVMGSSLSDSQKILLIRLNAKVVVIGDNDKAGRLFNQAVENKLHGFCEVIKIELTEDDCLENDSLAELDKETFNNILQRNGLERI